MEFTLAPVRHARYLSGLALLAAASLLISASSTYAALGDVSFQVKIASKEMVLENPGDMTTKMFAAWDSPYQRIADRNMPFLEVSNLADSTGNLTQFSITIGDTDYNFSDDYFGTYTEVGTSTPNANISSSSMDGDLLTVNFGNGGLAPGELVRFRIDLDPDPGNPDLFPHPDFRLVLFDMNDMDGNGVSDNAVVTGSFEDPNDATMTAMASTQLPDYAVVGPESQYFNQIVRPYGVMEGIDIFGATANTVIPEPTTAALVGLSIAGVARVRRRRA